MKYKPLYELSPNLQCYLQAVQCCTCVPTLVTLAPLARWPGVTSQRATILVKMVKCLTKFSSRRTIKTLITGLLLSSIAVQILLKMRAQSPGPGSPPLILLWNGFQVGW